jgi:hypothetical protein
VLRGNAERRAARDENTDVGSGRYERGDVCGGTEHLLEVVEHEEARPARDRRHNGVELAAAGRLGGPERPRDRRQDQPRLDDRREVDERRGAETLGGGDRQARLARATGPGERDEPRVRSAEEPADRGELEVATDQRRPSAREARVGFAGVVGRRRAPERRVLAEDALLQRPKLGRRLEPELVERRTRIAVCREGIGLPARPVEGEHLQRTEALAVRVGGDEPVELRHDMLVGTSLDVGGDACFEARQPGLLEAGRVGAREPLVGDVRERRPAPQGERLGVAALPGQLVEAGDVELARLDAHQVPGRTRHDPVDAERLAQRVDVDLQRAARARGRVFTPHRVDQPLGRKRLVRVEEQEHE